MLGQVLSSVANYVNDSASSAIQRTCCCTTDSSQKHGDLVPSDWDTREERSGNAASIQDPQAVKHSVHPSHAPPVPTSDGAEAAAQEALALRDLMKRFVQDMIQGKMYRVVVENGHTEPCRLSLTPNLQYLQLESAGVTHDIPLKNVKEVCPGRIYENKSSPIVLSEMDNTIVLRNNECVTFRLNSVEERDQFTKCIKVLHLALE